MKKSGSSGRKQQEFSWASASTMEEIGVPEGLEDVSYLQPIYKFDAKGKMRVWTCGVRGSEYHTLYGDVYNSKGGRSKLRASAPKEIAGNARERDPEEQAKIYADQSWREKQRKDSYYPSDCIPDRDMTTEEWLAAHGDKRRWPAVCDPWKDATETDKQCSDKNPWDMQFKLDGDRAMAWIENDGVKLYSRTCLEMKLKEHIRQQLTDIFMAVNFVITSMRGNPQTELMTSYPFGLDGEIWMPKNKHHQDSHGVAARQKTAHKDEEKLCFALFDIIDYEMSARERQDVLQQVEKMIRTHSEIELVAYDPDRELEMTQESLCLGGAYPNIFMVPMKTATSLDEVYEYYDYARQVGFEGIVVRRPRHIYPRAREQKNAMMMKLKPYEDKEFEVIGYKQAQADRAGCVVWMFRNDINDKTFEAQQMGTVEYQRQLYEIAEAYIGRRLTVQVTERSKEGVPKQGRVIKHRIDEDLVPADDN